MLRIIKIETDEKGNTVEHYLPIEDAKVTREHLMSHIGYLATLAESYGTGFIVRFSHLFSKEEQNILKGLDDYNYKIIFSNSIMFASVKLVTGSKPYLEFKIIYLKGGCLQEYKGSHLKQLCQEAQLEPFVVEEILKRLPVCLRDC
jgi:hypothetical protein